jgi:U4/U6 small nuclear ribonucleoprotein PRP31
MSGLANELLADLDDLNDSGDEYAPDTNTLKRKATSDPGQELDADMYADEDGGEGEEESSATLVLEGGVKPADELDVEDVQQMELGSIEDVSTIAKLEGSKRMADILKVSLSLHVCASNRVDILVYRAWRSIKKIPAQQRLWLCLRT